MHKKGRVIGTWFLTELLYKTFTLAYQCLTQLVVDFNHSPQKCLLFLISDETYTPTLYPTELWAHYLNLIFFALLISFLQIPMGCSRGRSRKLISFLWLPILGEQ
jgi:hypothetical protein